MTAEPEKLVHGGEFLALSEMKRIVPQPKDGRPWMLTSPLIYRCADGLTIVVPDGYRSDLASVPWFCRRMFPQDGPWTYAAIAHDWCCDIRPPHISSVRAAKIFREAMTALQVAKFQREAM